MASLAFDSSDTPARPPLSAHPAFPAMVALWFAALLGLGSLALPVVLLESVVSATGLASIVSAASPPLGMTARLLAALAAALAGGGLGVVIGRRVALAAAQGGESPFARLAPGLRAPLNIKDEVGAAGLADEDSLPLTRRRALALSDDAGEDPYGDPYDAMLPGERQAAIELAYDDRDFDEPLELDAPADDNAGAFPPGFADEPVADGEFDMTEEYDFPPEAPEPEPEREPLPFSAPSLARHAVEPEDYADEELRADEEFRAPLAAVEATGEPAAAGEWAQAPLEELGLVQLVQRLGSTIERRRELLAEAPVAPVTSVAAPAAPVRIAPIEFEAAPPEEAAQAMAAYFGDPAPTPAEPAAPQALQPHFQRPLELVDDDIEGDEDEEAADDGAGYSSLLGISHPFARLDDSFEPSEEPAPEDEPQDERLFDPPAEESAPQDADAALRAALATLQKMSGAA